MPILRKLKGCLVCNFKQPFSVFKQHFTHFNALFHPHVFLQIFSNNNFQFLNTCTKRALNFKQKGNKFWDLLKMYLKEKMTDSLEESREGYLPTVSECGSRGIYEKHRRRHVNSNAT